MTTTSPDGSIAVISDGAVSAATALALAQAHLDARKPGAHAPKLILVAVGAAHELASPDARPPSRDEQDAWIRRQAEAFSATRLDLAPPNQHANSTLTAATALLDAASLALASNASELHWPVAAARAGNLDDLDRAAELAAAVNRVLAAASLRLRVETPLLDLDHARLADLARDRGVSALGWNDHASAATPPSG